MDKDYKIWDRLCRINLLIELVENSTGLIKYEIDEKNMDLANLKELEKK